MQQANELPLPTDLRQRLVKCVELFLTGSIVSHGSDHKVSQGLGCAFVDDPNIQFDPALVIEGTTLGENNLAHLATRMHCAIAVLKL